MAVIIPVLTGPLTMVSSTTSTATPTTSMLSAMNTKDASSCLVHRAPSGVRRRSFVCTIIRTAAMSVATRPQPPSRTTASPRHLVAHRTHTTASPSHLIANLRIAVSPNETVTVSPRDTTVAHRLAWTGASQNQAGARTKSEATATAALTVSRALRAENTSPIIEKGYSFGTGY